MIFSMEVPMATECITLNYEGNYGYVEFNDETKELHIFIPNSSAMEQTVREYLTTPQTMDIPGKNGIREFETVTLHALDSVEVFKIVMTRLWVNTQVLVEWSIPPKAMDNL